VILASVWGYDEERVESNVDLYVHYLRRKLGSGLPIRTVRGVGYRID
jgi:DNA-binding response OmpR family regulator